MTSTEPQSNRALGLITLLTLIFVILKLTHAVDWSWWAVTAPVWVPLAIGFVVAVARAS